MVITKIPITPSLEQGALVRIGLKGGCSESSCNCSKTPYLFISDGKEAFAVTLTNEEASAILTGEPVDIR